MPVVANELHSVQLLAFTHIHRHNRHDDSPCNNMQSVNTSCGIVKCPKQTLGHYKPVRDLMGPLNTLDPQKADLGPNQNVGYDKILLFTKPETGQTVRIVWEFRKEALGKEIYQKYSTLSTYPQGLLKLLYNLPHLARSILAAG